jgi:hypothetical protein
MTTLHLTVSEKQVIVLVPEHPVQKDLQALWLLAPEGEGAEIWLRNTTCAQCERTDKAILVCAPGVTEDLFYTQQLWSALQQTFPKLSDAPGARRLLGLGDSAERCLKFVFHYPERFNIAVAVCPTTADQCRALLSYVEAYRESERPWPRTVIADCAQGMGQQMGDTINQHGVGLHVHAQRASQGWELMDEEIKSCLAHL